MSDRTIADFLATVGLLEGRDADELAALAQVMRRRTMREGETLFRQGDDARELLFVLDGAVSVSLRLPGNRTAEIGRPGPGAILGEIALLDGQGHTLTARAVADGAVLALGRLDFAALLATQHAAAFALRRRLAAHFTARLRDQLRSLATSLGGDSTAEAGDPAPAAAELEPCPAPDSRYVRRMATFHDFDPLALWGFLTSGKYVACPPGRSLVAEGAPATAYYLTINGAVEKVLVRGGRRIRVGLAGPGKAFGYEGLLDGRPSPVAAITRERSILLMLPSDVFGQLFHREDAVSRVFLEAIQRDLLATLRQTLRPAARLAASV